LHQTGDTYDTPTLQVAIQAAVEFVGLPEELREQRLRLFYWRRTSYTIGDQYMPKLKFIPGY
jgi:hypothetical protein